MGTCFPTSFVIMAYELMAVFSLKFPGGLDDSVHLQDLYLLLLGTIRHDRTITNKFHNLETARPQG